MTANSHATSGTGDKQDFLVFRLGDKEYGIQLDKVQELCSFDKVTRQQRVAAPVAGQLKLHGRHILVSDMHVLLDGTTRTADRLADVIVLNHAGQPAAVAVDCVIDVVTLAVPLSASAPACITGSITIGHRTIALLDIDALLPGTLPSPGGRLAA